MRWYEIATLVLGGGLVTKIFEWATGRRRSRADVASAITDAAARAVGVQDDVIERLQQQVQALVLEVDNLRRENDRLVTESAKLRLLVGRLEHDLAEVRSAMPPPPDHAT